MKTCGRSSGRKNKEAQQRKQNIQYALLALGIISFVLILFLLSAVVILPIPKSSSFLGVVALLVVFEFLNLLLHPFLERITHHNPYPDAVGIGLYCYVMVPLSEIRKMNTY